MELLLICLVSFIASGLTMFSGFGLGTLLLPVFGLFFPIDMAIAMTAIVHLLNNLFKLVLFRKKIDTSVLLRFGITSMLAAIAGAYVLRQLDESQVILFYNLGNYGFQITIIKVTIGVVMIIFTLFELVPFLKQLSFDKKYLPLGGLVSGFFGGLSGHQGALRSAFLIKLNLEKEIFIGTGVAIACLVDISRLSIYAGDFTVYGLNYTWILMPTLSAFLGAFIGTRLLKKITMKFLQVMVAAMIILFALALIAGLV